MTDEQLIVLAAAICGTGNGEPPEYNVKMARDILAETLKQAQPAEKPEKTKAVIAHPSIGRWNDARAERQAGKPSAERS